MSQCLHEFHRQITSSPQHCYVRNGCITVGNLLHHQADGGIHTQLQFADSDVLLGFLFICFCGWLYSSGQVNYIWYNNNNIRWRLNYQSACWWESIYFNTPSCFYSSLTCNMDDIVQSAITGDGEAYLWEYSMILL